jgi:hypothetical protein
MMGDSRSWKNGGSRPDGRRLAGVASALGAISQVEARGIRTPDSLSVNYSPENISVCGKAERRAGERTAPEPDARFAAGERAGSQAREEA